MSLINQMLQDLEKRRASGADRGALPPFVRTLPRTGRSRLSWWLAGGAGAVLVIAGLAWLLDSSGLMLLPRAPTVQRQPAAAPPAATAAPVPAPAGLPAEAPATHAIAMPPPVDPSLPEAPSGGDVARLPPIATAALIAGVSSAPLKREAPSGDVQPRKAEPGTAGGADVARAMPAPAPAGSRRAAADDRTDDRSGSALSQPQIDKRTHQQTPQQLAENHYRDGANLLNQGRLAEAQANFRLALERAPSHVGARQGLAGLLIESKKTGEAEQVLHEGLQLNPHQPGFAMALARMQVERGDTRGAVETLQKTASAAADSPDYLAFLAALMQRQSRHAEAVEHYRAALSRAPTSGVWLMGLGISLQALGRNGEARDAFQRAKATQALNGELQAFVNERLSQLHQR